MDYDSFLLFLKWQLPVLPESSIAVLGSYARGQATRYSDLDILLISQGAAEGQQHILRYDDLLVVVKMESPSSVASCLEEPLAACRNVVGLREAQVLADPSGFLHDMKSRAERFVWSEDLRARAAAEISRDMVGWLEEVHKGMNGLTYDDRGRMLQSVHGCSWGLLRVMQMYYGVLEHGDNTVVEDVVRAVGETSRWSRLLKVAIGWQDAQLRNRVSTGLRLYSLTATLIKDAFDQHDWQKVEPTLTALNDFIHSLESE